MMRILSLSHPVWNRQQTIRKLDLERFSYIEGTLCLIGPLFVENLDVVDAFSQNTWSQNGLGAASMQIWHSGKTSCG